MNTALQHLELYHEIFGSILDRKELTPYLLRNCSSYRDALRQSVIMMGNRGFDTAEGDLVPGEKERALVYVNKARRYFMKWLFPFIREQLLHLIELDSPQKNIYRSSLDSIDELNAALADKELSQIISDDPRHLFLLASSTKYPELFYGYKGKNIVIPPVWQKIGCSTLKMCHLIKAIEEDSQDINDYAQLGLFFETEGISLTNLFGFNWNNPVLIPTEEAPRRAFVKLSSFFHKMMESMKFDPDKKCYLFDSGDGVQVDIIDLKGRLKSPESMFTKLGKSVEGEAYNIRDILAITFILKSREDSLTLFHALQKRGVILQENTSSLSITQTLFDSPDDMKGAVRELMINLARSGGFSEAIQDEDIRVQTTEFFNALSSNAVSNSYSSGGHRKFQCKINYSLPVHRDRESREILIPGTHNYTERTAASIVTQQHTLPVEMRISDAESWEESEQKGEAHHDAYKFRQLIALINRLFDPLFAFPKEAMTQLRKDQEIIFK